MVRRVVEELVTRKMTDNKSFIFKSLKALETHGKLKEIYWLTESSFCEQQFDISWEDIHGAKLPVLKKLYPQLNKREKRKSKDGKDVYYKDEIVLDGIPFLVYNNWLPSVRTAFIEWVKTVLGNDFPELAEIKSYLR